METDLDMKTACEMSAKSTKVRSIENRRNERLAPIVFITGFLVSNIEVHMLKIALVANLLFIAPVYAQQENGRSIESVSGEKRGRKVDYNDLKEVDLGFIKISIPSALQKQEKKCIEGGCWKFADDEIVVSVDWNIDAWRPTFQRQYPSYAEELILVDNVRARFWSFQDKSRFKFISGANYATEKDHRIGLGIYLSSVDVDTRELAKKVFSTVKFTSLCRDSNGRC